MGMRRGKVVHDRMWTILRETVKRIEFLVGALCQKILDKEDTYRSRLLNNSHAIYRMWKCRRWTQGFIFFNLKHGQLYGGRGKIMIASQWLRNRKVYKGKGHCSSRQSRIILLLIIVRMFDRVEPWMIDSSCDGKAAESSQAVASEDQATTVSVGGLVWETISEEGHQHIHRCGCALPFSEVPRHMSSATPLLKIHFWAQIKAQPDEHRSILEIERQNRPLQLLVLSSLSVE